MRRNVWWLVGAGLVISLVLAFGVSRYASSQPDGLERVASDHGFIDTADDHALAEGPFADYSTRGVEDEGLSTGVAGVVGVVVTFGVAMAIVGAITVVRRSSGRTRRAGGSASGLDETTSPAGRSPSASGRTASASS